MFVRNVSGSGLILFLFLFFDKSFLMQCKLWRIVQYNPFQFMQGMREGWRHCRSSTSTHDFLLSGCLAHQQHLSLANWDLCWRSSERSIICTKMGEGGLATSPHCSPEAALLRTACTSSCLRTGAASGLPGLYSCLLKVFITICPGLLFSPQIELLIFNATVFSPLYNRQLTENIYWEYP